MAVNNQEYKGIDKFNKYPFEWIYGQSVVIDSDNNETYLMGSTVSDYDIITNPCRTTNLLDNKGNVIYGGDIVVKIHDNGKHPLHPIIMNDNPCAGVVVYNGHQFTALDAYTFDTDYDSMDDVLFYVPEKIRKVGNIFENPEKWDAILKKSKNADLYREFLSKAKFY